MSRVADAYPVTLLAAFAAGWLLHSSDILDQLRLVVASASLAVYFALVRSARSKSRTAWIVVSFTFGGGIASAPWVPQALSFLGAAAVPSWLAYAVLIVWSVGPCALAAALIVRSVRSQPLVVKLVAIGAVVFASEWLYVRVPGAVPWTLWGHAIVSDGGTAQLAALGGVPLVSAALAITGYSVLSIAQNARHPNASSRIECAVVAGSVALSLFGLQLVPSRDAPEAPTTYHSSFQALQADLPRGERLRAEVLEANLRRMTRSSASPPKRRTTARHASLVHVWPENAFAVPNADALTTAAADIAPSLEAPLITGVRISDDPTSSRNVVAVIQPDGSISDLIDKHIGVPVVESGGASSIESAVAQLLGHAGASYTIEPSETVRPVEDRSGPVIALCFEVLFPWLVEARRGDGATAILNLADDSWVGDERATRRLTTLARYRAIEQRLPLLRVAHGGLSAAFDRYGQPTMAAPLDQWATISLDAAPAPRPSLVANASVLAPPIATGLLVWLAYPSVTSRWRSARARNVSSSAQSESNAQGPEEVHP